MGVVTEIISGRITGYSFKEKGAPARLLLSDTLNICCDTFKALSFCRSTKIRIK